MLERIQLPNWSRKTWLTLGMSLAYIVWISGIFGNSGLLQAYELSKARYELSMRVKALESEKQRVKSSIDMLRNNRIAQESAIRETIGFTRENELVFEFR